MPEICLLDPDGDLAKYLVDKGEAVKNEYWACYHSVMYQFEVNGYSLGIVPCIVGSSYAVLVAEQLFASGCKFLISVTSAGVIDPVAHSKRFALITEAIRDEGTSYHYLPAGSPAKIQERLENEFIQGTNKDDLPWFAAKSWTTDAPYRETKTAIESMKDQNVCCVEMEASALYAFAAAKKKDIICFAHLTNTMAQTEGDFEKGEHFGSIATLHLITTLLKWRK